MRLQNHIHVFLQATMNYLDHFGTTFESYCSQMEFIIHRKYSVLDPILTDPNSHIRPRPTRRSCSLLALRHRFLPPTQHKMDHFGSSFWDRSLQNHSVIREIRLTYLCLDFLVVCFRGYFVTLEKNVFVSMGHFDPTRRTATRKTCVRVRVIAH